MRYEIRRFKDGVIDYDAEFWPDTPLDEVMEYAERIIAQGLADRVAAYDGDGTLILNVPRTLRPAS